ncbi:Transcription factor SRM1 [Glycine soja]|uniref:Transcription factor SRM1 n=1 Tax=Glycine soja TaxID=3848 RepID=A0A445FQD8_GLYSO|nr:Transcription factor SRM1 [Glycine soja]
MFIQTLLPHNTAPAVPIVLVVVAAPAPTIKLPTCGWFQVPFLRRIVIPAPPARAAWVPSPQGVAKSLDEIFNGISFDEVKVPRIYPWPHHLLPYNLESNHLMLSHHSNDLSRLFLIGLEICGEGNWKDISQLFVLSKTPTQVASHAKKYFQHKNTPKKVRKRRSIHDTTSEEDIDMIVTSHINQYNWVPPPTFAVQPHEMQQTKHIQQFDSYNPSHQMGGFKNFNEGHHPNELDLVVKPFIHNMPH